MRLYGAILVCCERNARLSRGIGGTTLPHDAATAITEEQAKLLRCQVWVVRAFLRAMVLSAFVACGGARAPDASFVPPPSGSADAGGVLAPVAHAAGSPIGDAAVDAPPLAVTSSQSLPRADVLDVYDESLLFADEIAHLADVARELVAAQRLAPVHVLSREEHADLDAIRASGRVRRGGAVCAHAPSAMRVANANGVSQGIALRFACSDVGVCDVRIELVDGSGPPERFAYWPHMDDWTPLVRVKTVVATGTDPAALERALRASTPETFTWEKRATMSRPPLRPSPGHLVLVLRTASAWSTPPTPDELATEQTALDACPGSGVYPPPVVVAVAPRGAVTRCEPVLADGDPISQCICRALAKHTFAATLGATSAGASERRLRLEPIRARSVSAPPLTDPTAFTPPRRTVELEAILDEAKLPEDWEASDTIHFAGQPIADCFQVLSARRDDAATFQVEIDDGGLVKSATLTEGEWMTDAQKACTQRGVSAMKLECPVVDAERQFALRLSVGR